MNAPNQPNIKLVNAPDYRENYANSVQVRVNVWDFFLVFGTMQQQTESQVEVKNFQGIYLSPQQAKALMAILAAKRGWLRERLRRDQARSPHGRRRSHSLICTVTTNAASRRYPTPLLFTLFFLGLFALHAPLLRLPYFWDEAGYYIPAARDLLLSGSLIPHSAPSNAHPPLVMAYLALAWKLLGFTPVVTRTAMLADRRLHAAGCVSSGRASRQHPGCNRFGDLHRALSRVLHPEFARPPRPGRRRTHFLGTARLRGRSSPCNCNLVLARGPRQRNRDPRAIGSLRLGTAAADSRGAA